ncbi:MAG TPA: dihydroneopterin aldolase [Bacteroidia bacterium]|nr:dihydroneopterin aldolase [Bacteroidia bacterium]
MMNLIAVEGINLYAYHGCLAEEGLIGGNYIVDVYMQTDFTEAAKTDDLNKTIDYCAIYEIAKKEMAIRAKLIEEVAMRIHKTILKDFTAVQKARVRVTKLKPPMNGNVDKVYVEIE